MTMLYVREDAGFREASAQDGARACATSHRAALSHRFTGARETSDAQSRHVTISVRQSTAFPNWARGAARKSLASYAKRSSRLM